MNDTPTLPTILVIYGATGDLVAKKIIPALFHLHEKQKLPTVFRVIGFARRDLQDVYRAQVSDIVRAHAGNDLDEDSLESFLDFFHYHRGNFDEPAGYTELATKLGQIDGEWKTCSNKLFYLAVPPESYQTIFEQLSASGLTTPCGPDGGWTRVIVEKPIGRDAKTAEELDELMGKLFKEEQIYRIDHYLAKEMVQNILTFRFSNSLFEDIWDNNFIERIDIRLDEKIGVEKRGAFYDSLGTLRDVGQNHLLQMLAFATMEQPEKFDADSIRSKRADILRMLTPWTDETLKAKTRRAQYDGYRQIDGVKPDSMVETFFHVETSLDHPRWKGVPITIESGKRMGTLRKDMVIEFKHKTPCLCPPGQDHMKNGVTFQLEPDEKISIQFWAKKPGLTFEVEERSLDLTLREPSARTQYVEEYEKLLMDCIVGDQTLFISTDEVKAMWAFTDPIVEAWAKDEVPMGTYKPDTDEAKR
ncbi:MAG: glucose-6-phosphate dehydrogenase [Patescibacteria group bacterium]